MNAENDIKKEEEISLSDMIVMFIKRKWWFVGTVLIVLVIGMTYVFLQPINYLLTYQIEMKEDYSYELLNELYPNYEKDINYLTLHNIPVRFKQEKVFILAKDIDEKIDYKKLWESDSVKIDLIKDTSIFNISVSNSDYGLADNIAFTLITAFENMIEDRQRMILSEVLGKIDTNIENLKNENTSTHDAKVTELEKEVDALYEELDKYIIDYNIDLSNKLEENRNNDNISFYNIIIPPNDISSKISTFKKEIDMYEARILENESKIIDLNILEEKLISDEDIITERIRLVSDSPSYEVESNKLRNIAIVIVLSIILGIMMTFIINFIQNSKIKEKIRKK